MIDKAYWNKIASEWKKQDDGIHIPDVDTGGAAQINPDEESFGKISDDEIDDILADLDLDDI